MKTLQKSYRILPVALLLLVLSTLSVSAQRYWDDDDHPLSLNMPQISLITVMPNNSAITLALGIPISPGERPPDNVSETRDSTKWLNYTCSTRGRRSRRKVDVQITQGAIPTGLKISVKAMAIRPYGSGTRGRPTRTVWLSSASQTLVTNIGNCHTGRGIQRGHRLIYQLKLDDFNTLDAESNTAITVTYTISDL
jgi:hypothetical protein